MFPQIAKRKKKEVIIADRFYKEWEEVSKEVEQRAKLALKKIPNAILHDYSKVCRIKSIPDFYANYFIAFSHRNQETTMTTIFQEEIEKILTHSSHFHKISAAIKEREEILQEVKNALMIVEGFMLMNQGKNIPLAAKGPIEELVKGCQTLEELRALEKQKTEELAYSMIKIRQNIVKMYTDVAAWRTYLEQLAKSQGTFMRKLRIIYPHQGINSLLLLFYDTEFIRQSVLKTEVHFSKEQDDPFFQRLGKNKTGGPIQQHLCDVLKSDGSDYREYVVRLKQEIPTDEGQQQRQRLLEEERIRCDKAKEQKERQLKIKAMREQRKGKVERHTSVRNIRIKKTQGADRTGGIKTSRGTRSQKKILDVDSLLASKGDKELPTKDDLKIIGVYQKGRIPVKNSYDSSIIPEKQELQHQRRVWQKQIKEEQQEKQKIKRLLKQTEKKALVQTKQFEEKLKKYQDEVSRLKSRIDQAKANKRPLASSQRLRRGSRNKKAAQSVISVYGSISKESNSNSAVGLLSSKLEQESRIKRSLELQIRQLEKEKQKLEKTLERQNQKMSKQSAVFQRKLDKYEEAITKLKGQSESNKKVIRDLEQSKMSEQYRANSKLKMYGVREKQQEMKQKIMRKIQQAQKNNQKSRSIEKPQPSYQSGSSREEAARRKKQAQIQDTYDWGTQQKRRRSEPRQERSSGSIQNSQLEQKILEQSREKNVPEQQVKQLGREKNKQQRNLQRQSHKISKQTANFQKKLQKYEQTIMKLKGENSHNKKTLKDLQNSRSSEQKGYESLGMYTGKQQQEELKRNIMEKIESRRRRKKDRIESEARRRAVNNSLSKSKSISLVPGQHLPQNLEIVKTKQTIEIVFEPGQKRKKRQQPNQELKQAESRLMKLQKQRQLLEKKLEMSAAGKDTTKRLFESRIQENEHRVDKFKDQLQRQRDRNHKLEENIRQMRKSINNQFEVKIARERVRFERQKEDLLRTIQKEKQERYNKDRVLEEQMKFLKEMEKNQKELIDMLNRQKQEKKDKEQMLLEELEKKEELMNMLQIEEIKKNIQREVRRQLLDNDQQQNQSDVAFDERKARMEEQIQKLRMDRDTELSELDDQNQKLRELIGKIKGQEENLLYAIKENIDLDSEDEKDSTSLKDKTMSDNFKSKIPTEEKQKQQKAEIPINKEKLLEELQNKSSLQLKNEQKQRQYYSDIENSSQYKEKEKLQHLVELYLKSPHQYPEQKTLIVEKQEKKHLAQQLEHKTRLIKQFQNQLFSTKDLPSYVPQLKNDAINNHLLILRDAYQDLEADALRRQLFPPLREEQVYNDKELSVESEEPPIISIMDNVRDHAKRHSPHRKDDKKNFLAINRMRLMLLEDNKKQKQRQMIEQESRKKMQKDLFDKNRKKREKHMQRRKQKQDERKIAKLNKSKQRPLKPKKSSRAPTDRSKKSHKSSLQKSDKLSSNKSNLSSESKHASKQYQNSIVHISYVKSKSGWSQSEAQKQKLIPSDEKLKITELKSKKSEKQMLSDSQRQIKMSQRKDRKLEKNISSDSQKLKITQLKSKKSEREEEAKAIKEEKVQHSLDVHEQEQLQKIERQVLKSEIKSIQSQVRSYISGQEQFKIYQQFINEEEMPNYIDQLLQLSSEELINLNGNASLKQDYKDYCSLSVLVAKNGKGIEIGIGLFHKEYQTGQYICDFIMAHKMIDFLNLVFNFSKYIYTHDRTAQKIQLIFDLQYVEDHEVLHHFLEFENKCRRMGEVYVKPKNTKERKYILKRVLFEEVQDMTVLVPNSGVDIKVDLKVFDALMMEVNEGFDNDYNLNYSSINLLLAYYLSKNPERLNEFRKNAENELYYRQVLLTALLFAKKQVSIKHIEEQTLDKRGMLQELSRLKNKLDIVDVEEINEMKLSLTQKLPMTAKRCIIEVQHEQTNYLIVRPEQAVTRVQSSNSSQIAYFLNLIPKFKIMLIEAEQFLTMQKSNPQLTAFFYIKHFIKNITEVQKQTYERVYLPQLAQHSHLMAQDASKRIGGTILTEQSIRIGWKDSLSNSIVFTPKHNDLVIQKPFIVAVLSGVVERAVEGSPLCVRLIE